MQRQISTTLGILMVVLVAVVARAAVFLFSKGVEFDEKVIEETIEEEIIEENEFKDWKTYKNAEFGFEVRYPETVAERGVTKTDTNLIVGEDSIEYPLEPPRKIHFASIDFPQPQLRRGYHAPPEGEFIPIKTVDDWIEMYEIEDIFAIDGHGRMEECYSTTIAGFPAGVCKGDRFGTLPIYREKRDYFLITPEGGFELSALILTSYEDPFREEVIYKTPQSEINEFYQIVRDLLSTFSFQNKRTAE